MSPAVITFPSNVTSSSTMTSCNHGISPPAGVSKNSFVLKFRTNQIKFYQACCFNYEGANDTIGLVVVQAERRLVSNLATGVQIFGRESNSHYYFHVSCLRKADPGFVVKDLVIPDDVQSRMSAMQKVYLSAFLQL